MGGSVTPDRRTHPRVPVSIDGRWQGQAAAGLCQAVDLGLGGCFARTGLPPPLDERILITLFLGGRGAMPIAGHVSRVDPSAGFAVRFDDMPPEARYRLSEEITRIRRRTPAASSTVIS